MGISCESVQNSKRSIFIYKLNMKLANQICTEMDEGIPAPFQVFKNFIDVKGLCLQVFTLPGSVIVKTACAPFGLCPTGKGPVVACPACPVVMKTFIGMAVCGVLPPLPFVNVRDICFGINERLKTTDFMALCATAGFC